MKTKLTIKEEKGVAAVEFAILLPMLILLLFGIIECGLLLYNKQVITNASREGVRAGITGISETDIRNIVNDYCFGEDGTEKRLITFGTAVTSLPDDKIIITDEGNNNISVTVDYDYDFLVLANMGFGPVTLEGKTLMKLEQW